MTEPTEEELTISLDDEVFFRLLPGRRPAIYPDTVTRVGYEMGIDVLHVGAVWALGYLDDEEALELDDGTIVAVGDIDPDSFVLDPGDKTPR